MICITKGSNEVIKTKSAHPHPHLFNSVGEKEIPNDYGYVCSECRTGFPCGLRFECEGCKYVNCPACYESLSSPNKNEPKYPHPHRHKLTASENEYTWRCRDCKESFKTGKCMYCPSIFCSKHKYCLKCIETKTDWEQPKGYKVPDLLNAHHHFLELTHRPPYAHSLYTCHKCIEVFGSSGYHCRECEYNLCPVCYNTEINRTGSSIVNSAVSSRENSTYSLDINIKEEINSIGDKLQPHLLQQKLQKLQQQQQNQNGEFPTFATLQKIDKKFPSSKKENQKEEKAQILQLVPIRKKKKFQ